jgi:acetolactate synthase I/III small subunit
MRQEDDHAYTLILTVRNQPGVLVRCAQVFGRRGHNIEALQVSPNTKDESIATMTISAFGRPEVMQQIVVQLTKLVDVITVTEKDNMP